MSKPMKVISIVITKDTVTLYDENWQSHVYQQGSSNIVLIRDKVIPEFTQHGVAYFSSTQEKTIYSTFESKSKVVKFFTMARDMFKQYFQKDTSGKLSAQLKRLLKSDRTGLQKLKNSDFGGIAPGKEQDIPVAIVEDSIIPHVDKLSTLINHANETDSSVGLENLLLRLSNMIHTKDHTVEDVITFLEKSDLPITNNGDILVYKAVNKHSEDNGQTIYTDCHTGKVKQFVGSLVQVPLEYVNKSRYANCAQGLHVAQRSYLSEFKATHCLLCIVRPEDIIAVPYGYANKVRIRAYHIIDVLTDEEYQKVLENTSFICDSKSELKYNRAIYNQYPHYTDVITIFGKQGTEITHATVKAKLSEPVEVIEAPVVSVDSTIKTIPVPAKETIKVSTVKSIPAFTSKEIRKLLPCTNYADAVTLKEWKIRNKKSWAKLGVSDKHAIEIETYLKDSL